MEEKWRELGFSKDKRYKIINSTPSSSHDFMHTDLDWEVVYVRTGERVLFFAGDRYDKSKIRSVEFLGNEVVARSGTGRIMERHTLPSEKDIAFIKAVKYGNIVMVKQFLSKGINPDTMDIYHVTALQHAAERGRMEIAELLIEKGANIEARDKFLGRTPLMRAVVVGNLEMVKLLLKHGARTSVRDKYVRPFIESLPLLAWAALSNIEILKLIIKKKFNKHILNEALSAAVFYNKIESAKLLLDRGADPNDKLKRTRVLSYAVKNNSPKMVKLLLEYGAKINKKDMVGDTPLIKAVDKGYHKIVKILLLSRARLDIKDDYGKTALYYARKKGRKRILKLFNEYASKRKNS